MYRRVCPHAHAFPRVRPRSTSGALAVLLLLAVARPAAAQSEARGTVAGTVVDDSTGAPVPRATVFVVGTTQGALTDDVGRFAIGELTAGEHTLRVRILSYRQRDVSVAVVGGDTVRTT